METRRIALHGLGFGDCGKGMFTDALCRLWRAHTVVRFNGGAQAGHNVVLPDGRHHTFSQFGSGTFQPGVATVLAYPVVVHPGALLVENAHLVRAGVTDAFDRLLIDRRCRINTPFHQAAGRLRELRRGAAAHGTCGVGVGETVRHALAHPEQVLHYGDLPRRALAHDKLEAIRHTLREELTAADCADVPDVPVVAVGPDPAVADERRLLDDAGVSMRWLDQMHELTVRVPPADPTAIAERLQLPGTVIFEGAQGVLLDEWRGFHPHTTWSNIHREAATAVLADAGGGADVPLRHLGVLRSYLTRHGPGPLPTWDAALDRLAEPHNAADGWQGRFRRGHPDAVLLRYALAALGGVDGLLLSHLDAFDDGGEFKLCGGYRVAPGPNDPTLCQRDPDDNGIVTQLRAGPARDLDHQTRLTTLLGQAQPQYESEPLRSAADLLERIAALTGCPILFGAHGPTHATMRAMVPYR